MPIYLNFGIPMLWDVISSVYAKLHPGPDVSEFVIYLHIMITVFAMPLVLMGVNGALIRAGKNTVFGAFVLMSSGLILNNLYFSPLIIWVITGEWPKIDPKTFGLMASLNIWYFSCVLLFVGIMWLWRKFGRKSA